MFLLYVLYFIATSCYFYICILFKLPESDKMKFLMIIARKKGFFFSKYIWIYTTYLFLGTFDCICIQIYFLSTIAKRLHSIK